MGVFVCTVAAVLPIYLIAALCSSRPLVGGRSFWWWEALPLLLLLLLDAFLACLNWDYASKLWTKRPDVSAADFSDAYLGPLLLAMALGAVILAGLFLFLIRLLKPRLFGPSRRRFLWIPVFLFALAASLLTAWAIAIVALSPAGIGMRQAL